LFMITLQSRPGNYITAGNRRYSYFAGNNYLGLAGNTELIDAAKIALDKYGVNFSASRQTTGTSEIHEELEQLLASFKNRDDAVVYASGYMGNFILLHSLIGSYSAVFADSFAHPSILDAVPENVVLKLFDHCNPGKLDYLLSNSRELKPLIITDGIFPLTGEITPLDEIYALAKKYGAILIIDDAHSTGVLGKDGRGTPEYFNLDDPDTIIQTETLSKAMGAYGGFISAGKELIDKIRFKSTFYGASTALPPPVVAAGCASVRLITRHPELREMLHNNASFLREGIRDLGLMTTGDPTPIIPVIFKDRQKAEDLSGFLEAAGIIAPLVDYPVNIDSFIIRLTVSSDHTKEQMKELLYHLKLWRDKNGTGNH
jgi:7-keto-8-aminopelargonate synthetase-like enzyme